MTYSADNNLLLPKGYLSWSQLNKFESSPNSYIKEYIEKGQKFDNAEMRFGKKIAKMIEDGSYKSLIPDLPVLGYPEFKIQHSFIRGIPILAYMDDFDPFSNNLVFNEYKTGVEPWTQARTEKHGQLKFYACALRSIPYNRARADTITANLVWLETSKKPKLGLNVSNDIYLTGKMKTFTKTFSAFELDEMENRIYTVAHRISKVYQDYLNAI